MNEFSPETELRRTLRALASASRSHAPESEESAAIALAARALLFLHSRQELDAFLEWLESHEQEASAPVFPSMAEALGWLELQPQAAQGSFVQVEQETYVIALGPTGSFVLVRSVTHHAPAGA